MPLYCFVSQFNGTHYLNINEDQTMNDLLYLSWPLQVKEKQNFTEGTIKNNTMRVLLT
jgi:hypothetical protein